MTAAPLHGNRTIVIESGEEKLMQEAKAARIGRAVLGFPFLRHFCHSEPQFEIDAARAVYKIEARELFGPMRLFG